MNPAQWDKAMAPDVPWTDAYGTVEREARELLSHSTAATFSTTGLVDALLMPGTVQDFTRKRVFKATKALATRGLADCCTKGEPEKNAYAQTIHRWTWHAPTINGLSLKNGDTATVTVRHDENGARVTAVHAATQALSPVRCPKCGHRL